MTLSLMFSSSVFALDFCYSGIHEYKINLDKKIIHYKSKATEQKYEVVKINNSIKENGYGNINAKVGEYKGNITYLSLFYYEGRPSSIKFYSLDPEGVVSINGDHLKCR